MQPPYFEGHKATALEATCNKSMQCFVFVSLLYRRIHDCLTKGYNIFILQMRIAFPEMGNAPQGAGANNTVD